jgi:type II secretory ATPase GspE/PulE/Tfp pilus assembly ATPase PilB-like protein
VGYKGRLAVYEIMTMNDEMRRLTASRADAVLLYETARKTGFLPMREDALAKVKMGLTDENEVYRILH